MRCDVTSEDDVQALLAARSSDLGHIDVWMNNAGLGGNGLVTEMTDEQWSKVLDVTLTGTFRCLRAVLPHMYERGCRRDREQRVGARLAGTGPQAHYAAAKAGVMALTRCTAVEAAEHGVRVNAVAPSLAMHPNPGEGDAPGPARGAEGASRGLRPRRRAVGGRQRDGVPGERSVVVHDRRGRAGLEPARLTPKGAT
jgi:3-oxoacyl-[acyl-carrier protein] reductase